MQGYLGEKRINVKTHPKFKDWDATDWAMLYIEQFRGIDGSHHEMWLRDQVARILKGTPVKVTLARWSDGTENFRYTTGKPSKEYKKWVKEMLGERDEDGYYEYSYDQGVAP